LLIEWVRGGNFHSTLPSCESILSLPRTPHILHTSYIHPYSCPPTRRVPLVKCIGCLVLFSKNTFRKHLQQALLSSECPEASHCTIWSIPTLGENCAVNFYRPIRQLATIHFASSVSALLRNLPEYSSMSPVSGLYIPSPVS